MGVVSSIRFSFGAFIFDAETNELFRNSRRLRIPEQCAITLTLLLQEAGSLVSREQIRQHLWPDSPFVDHDHSINKIVTQLRAVLRDDPHAPQFLETIPKKGYRFVAAVQAVEMPSVSMQSVTEVSTKLETNAENASPVRQLAHSRMPRRSRLLLRSAAALLMVAALAWLGWREFDQRHNAEPILIGIAPLESEGTGAEQLAQSFRLELSDAVAQLPSVQVRTFHTFSDKPTNASNARDDMRDLKLDLLLYGKIALQNDQCHLQFELVRGADATHIASYEYSGGIAALASIRDKLQADLFNSLDIARGIAPNHGNTANPNAYAAYLRGSYNLSRRNDDAVNQAVADFKQALQYDPQFAKAVDGLANAQVLLAEHGIEPRNERYQQAKQLAQQAIQLDPLLADAYAVHGFAILRADWNVQAAERDIRKAIQLNPDLASPHIWLSLVLCVEGRSQDSFREIDHAHALDPRWGAVDYTEVYVAMCARNFPRAMAAGQRIVDLMPDWPQTHNQRGWVLWYAGRNLEAIHEWKLSAGIENDRARMELEDRALTAYRRGGMQAYARIRLQAIDSGRQWRHPADFNRVEWLIYAARYDQALNEIDRMIRCHDPNVVSLAVSPAYYNLHGDPRFRALVAHAGIPFPTI